MMSLPYRAAEGQVLHTPHLIGSNLGPTRVIGSGAIKSENFSSGSAGWSIDGDGNVEFNSGNFRGDITGASGSFSGAVTASSIDIDGDADPTTSFHVDGNGNMWLGAALFANGTFKVTSAGVVTATDITITGGSQNINSGTWQVATNGNVTVAGTMTLSGNLLVDPGTIQTGTTAPYVAIEDDEIRFFTNATNSGRLVTSGDYSTVIQAPNGGSGLAQVSLRSSGGIISSPYVEIGADSFLMTSSSTEVFSFSLDQITMGSDIITFASGGVEILDLTSAWNTYTPSLKGSVSDPTLGSGATQTGAYMRVGKLCIVYAQIIIGTGPGTGSGNYSITLPFNAGRTQGVAGICFVNDSSVSQSLMGLIQTSSASDRAFMYWWGGATPANGLRTITAVGNGNPMTLAAGDSYTILVAYEIA